MGPEPPAEPSPVESKPPVSGVFGVIIVAQLLVLGLGCVVGTVYSVTQLPNPSGEDIAAAMLADPTFTLMVLAATQLAIALSLWKGPRAFEGLRSDQLSARLGWSNAPVRWLEVLLVAAGMWACGLVILVPLRHFRGPPTGALANFGRLADATSPAQFALLVLFGAVTAGLSEELLFRGFIQRRLVERWGAAVGVSITATLFAVWHFDLDQGLYALGAGLWLGLAAHRTGSTVTVAMAHIGSNTWSFIASRVWGTAGELEPWHFALGGGVLLACAWALFRLTATVSDATGDAGSPPT